MSPRSRRLLHRRRLGTRVTLPQAVGMVLRPCAAIALGAGLMAVVGMSLVSFWPALSERLQADYLRGTQQRVAAPHVLPLIREAPSLRLAMVDDLIHQRVELPGPAWYQAREKRLREELEWLKERSVLPEDPSVLFMFDDMAIERELHAGLAVFDELAIGRGLQGRSEEGLEFIAANRRTLTHLGPPSTMSKQEPVAHIAAALRLAQAPPLDKLDEAWYRFHATRGTLLAHAAIGAALAGDEPSRQRLREASAEIERSLAIKPQGHFGREVWQALALRYLLAVIEDPSLSARYSMIGLPLDPSRAAAAESRRRPLPVGELLTLRPPYPSQQQAPAIAAAIPAYRMAADWLQAIELGNLEDQLISIANDPEAVLIGFDQPTMGLMNMWTLGGGPNPFSALSLGQLMEIAGQPSIAWSCYQHALLLMPRFPWLPPEVAAYCQQRQEDLVDIIANAGKPMVIDSVRATLERTFTSELAASEAWQQQWQQDEARLLAEGQPLDTVVKQLRALHGHPDTVTPRADTLLVTPPSAARQAHRMSLIDMGLFGSLFGALATWLGLLLRSGIRRRQAVTASPADEGSESISRNVA